MSLPSSPHQDPQGFLRHLFDTAVARAQPLLNMAGLLPTPPRGRTLVLGAGKAAGAMAQALEQLWPVDARLEGLVVTRYHHTPPRPEGLLQRIDVVEASHPVPDQAGMDASARMLALTQGLSSDDLVICLVSGGGSALLTLPADGLSLADKQRINRELLACGAPIGEMNTVRKHLSRIKGGRLAAACAPAQVLTLTISDVPGDDPGVIASGPSVPDETTCDQALALLDRYGIAISQTVRTALQNGSLETPKPTDPAFAGHQVKMMATPMQSLQAAADAARATGLNAYILSDEIEGESREVAKVHAALARAAANGHGPFQKPCVILSGGETTVTLRTPQPGFPKGKGGRAGEFCLGLAMALQGQKGVWALAADTDGIDGVEDNAGALVTPDSLQRCEQLGLKPAAFADRNDSYRLFEALGDLVVSGPTHTNVNDFRALLVL
ncbi:MAG: glycerate kinase [Betaproteobacteria bacterium]|nr:glycerate kinase [Betaproteobacteria bacterium]